MIKNPTNPSQLPPNLPILPISGAFLLPATHRPLNIFEPNYIELVDHILASNRLVGLIQPALTGQTSSRYSSKENKTKQLANIGTIGKLVHFEEIDQEKYLIILEGITRFKLGKEIISKKPFQQFEINSQDFAHDFTFKLKNSENYIIESEAINRTRFLSVMRNYAKFAEIDINWNEVEQTNIIDLVNLVSMHGPYNDKERQLLLEAKTIKLRAQTLIALAELEMGIEQQKVTLQ